MDEIAVMRWTLLRAYLWRDDQWRFNDIERATAIARASQLPQYGMSDKLAWCPQPAAKHFILVVALHYALRQQLKRSMLKLEPFGGTSAHSDA